MRTDGHRLVLLRHAKSSWAGDLADVDRPLNGRGRRDAAAVGRRLAEQGRPDLVLCSSAARTRETWARAVAACGPLAAVPVRLVDAIYQADAGILLDEVRQLPEDVRAVLVVGHAPGLPDLAHRLAGDAPDDFPTSALAVLQLDGR